jgi:hypothetical protein
MKRPAVRPILTQIANDKKSDAVAAMKMVEQAKKFVNMPKTKGNDLTDDENAIRVVLSLCFDSGRCTRRRGAPSGYLLGCLV